MIRGQVASTAPTVRDSRYRVLTPDADVYEEDFSGDDETITAVRSGVPSRAFQLAYLDGIPIALGGDLLMLRGTGARQRQKAWLERSWKLERGPLARLAYVFPFHSELPAHMPDKSRKKSSSSAFAGSDCKAGRLVGAGRSLR